MLVLVPSFRASSIKTCSGLIVSSDAEDFPVNTERPPSMFPIFGMNARLFGLLSLAVSMISMKVFVWDLLERARLHCAGFVYDANVTGKAICFTGFLITLGLFFLVTGEKGKLFLLRPGEKPEKNAFNLFVLVLSLSPGIILYTWVLWQLQKFGYP